MNRRYQPIFVLLISLICNDLCGQNLWEEIKETSLSQQERTIIPEHYSILSINLPVLKSILFAAPHEDQVKAIRSSTIIPLPTPDGTVQSIRFVESPIMEPALAAKFPSIKTYLGVGADDPTILVRMDLTLNGFHAVMTSPKGTMYIDPYFKVADQHYISYHKKDYTLDNPQLAPECLGTPSQQPATDLRSGANRSNGEELIIYRLALAASGEYTAYHGGTIAGALSAMTTGLNRLNLIFERDLAIRMTLIANNDQIIYTNSATDPFSNGIPSTMIIENHNNITTVIGSPNFDIGHLLTTIGGGLAQQQGPCRNTIKGMGVTATSPPNNNPYYTDFVAHQLGHQLGANHTFNGTSGTCNGNRNYSTAYEPGSGTTIMGYAGKCNSHNVQSNSDAYFSKTSFEEIIAYTRLNAGYACANKFSSTNVVPISIAGAGGFFIPKETPFVLNGSAIDPDASANLTYCWEQNNLGPAGDPSSPFGSAPIFRSFEPTASASRTFPKLSDLVNNTQTYGEFLPTYARQLDFCLTVRDNQPGAGGVDTDCISFEVVADGPFEVLYPNNYEVWSSGFVENVSWDVANTNQAPVNCATVNILLSTDGGQTYTVQLASNVPNDGNEPIIVPAILSSSIRLKVACADNIFFDISNTNLTIVPTILRAELLDFSGKLINKHVQLAWTTGTEESLRGFEVEVMKKDGALENYGFVSSKGNPAQGATYAFNLPLLSAGEYYFRLKIKDQDGSASYSEVIALKIPEIASTLVAYPNPVKDVINFDLSLQNSDGLAFKLYNSAGQLAIEQTSILGAGMHILTFDVSRLSPGIYFYQLQGNTLQEQGRICIE